MGGDDGTDLVTLTTLTTDGVDSNTFRHVRHAVLQGGCLRLG